MKSQPSFRSSFVAFISLALFSVNSTTAQGLLETSSVKPRPAVPPAFEQFLNAWRFDGSHWKSNAHWQPLAMLDAQFVPGWSGHALRMAGENPALLALRDVANNGTTNLLAGAGTIRFWFAPSWTSASAQGSGPGIEVRLLETGAWSAQAANSWCSLVIDADGDSIRLEVQGASGTETVLSAEIGWCAGEWHQVALATSAETGTVLFIDGQAVASGDAVDLLPANVSGAVRGFCLGSDMLGESLAQGEFDEIYTFAKVLTESEVAAEYQWNAGRAALGPIMPGGMTLSAVPSPEEGTNNNQNVVSLHAGEYGCALWLKVRTNTTNSVLLTLTNTTPGRTYKIWSKTNLSVSTWTR
jgi:hypothetical protein